MTKRAVLYARVSGDDRGKEGRNLAGQLEMCREYALDHGWQIVEELAEDDRGASGADLQLPQLGKVREMARTGAFDVLVVREIDRLSRSLAKQLVVENELERSGVEIVYVLGKYPDTPEGNLHKHVRAAVAEYERLVIRERVARARQLKIAAGHVVTRGNGPYGYRVAERDGQYELVIHEPEAEIVRQIFHWYTVGDEDGTPLTTYAIQKQLNAMQVPTYADARPGLYPKKRGYGEWARSAIQAILGNETYAGTWRYRGAAEMGDGDWREVAVPAIISRVTWEHARARQARRSHLGRRIVVYDCLLRNRVRCDSCGASAQVQPKADRGGRRRRYYRCAAACGHLYSNYARPCNAPLFRVDAVDRAVWEWVRSLLTSPAVLEQGHRALYAEEDRDVALRRARLASIDKLLAENGSELRRLLDAYLAGDLTMEMLATRRDELEAAAADLARERGDLQRRLEPPTLPPEQLADLRQFAARVADGLARSDADFAFRREVIEGLDVSIRLAVEDGAKVVIARGLLGGQKLPLVSPGAPSGKAATRGEETEQRLRNGVGS